MSGIYLSGLGINNCKGNRSLLAKLLDCKKKKKL